MGGQGRGRAAIGVVWALAPLISFGLATPAIFVYAAVRLRSVWQWLAAALYAAVLVALLLTPDTDSLGANLAYTAWILGNVLGGTAHAFAIRRRVFERRGEDAAVRRAFDDAVWTAVERGELRDKARAVAARDPLMAMELHIGRPDLPRASDDGGLIDVNHAPPAVLAELPGLTSELVERIVGAREALGTFTSAEDLSATAGLPPHLTPALREYGVYLP
ncbi:MAG TPA: helix-hairpin-helix domain-containing protein [Streptosporangiaceae bacterium]|nr:helix-hairpin-helix domain-containing protein [Streptosporangiaceae bacterium]